MAMAWGVWGKRPSDAETSIGAFEPASGLAGDSDSIHAQICSLA